MESTEKPLEESLPDGQGWIYLFMNEKVSEFKDIGFTCSNCGDYHSIYIPCPLS